MRRSTSRLLLRLQRIENGERCPTACFSTNDKPDKGSSNEKPPPKKDARASSAPISQLFSKLNLNVKTDRNTRGRTGTPPPPPPTPRPQQSGPRSAQVSQEQDAWSRPQRSQSRPPGEASFDPAGEDDFNFGRSQQQRPRQRQRPGQDRARRGPNPGRGGSSAGGRGSQLSSPRRRTGPATGRRPAAGRGGREAQMMRNAPKEIQDLAAEEEIFRLREGEPMGLIDKESHARIRNTGEMPIRGRHLRNELARAQVMAMDPTVNINWGAPIHLPRFTIEEMFETESESLKEALNIETEEEWQETKHVHLERTKVQIEAQNKMLGIRDEKADEAVLFGMRDSVPDTHPMRNHVNMVAHQLTRNPGWSFQEKHQYMSKLLHEYVHKQL